MSPTNPVHPCSTCGQMILTLPNTDGTGDYEEHSTDAVPAEKRLIWLGSVGVVPLPRDWPQPATVLSRHHCPAAPTAPADDRTANPDRREQPQDDSDDRIDGDPPTADELQPQPWSRTSLRAQLVELNRLRTVMTLYRAQQTGQLRPHPGQRTYEPVSISRALADTGHLSPTRCPLCNRLVAEDAAMAVATIESDPDAVLRCCLPECVSRPRQ